MTKSARGKLVQLLTGEGPSAAHSTMLRLPGDALTLEVADLGKIGTPIRAAQAKRLITAARPALYGRGEQTLSDTSVRDTWEISPDQVQLGGQDWPTYLDTALGQIREDLGLPDGARLSAQLHSLLLYGKGQFFLPHQDSEKHEQMVATLVIMLPSIHSGGELVIDDAGTQRTYAGSRDDLVLVAFYADRRHEVLPVRSGYRISMTFNLLLENVAAGPVLGPVEQAAAHLAEHFATPVTSQHGNRDLGTPRRLAFLLDHEYTQGGLEAGHLKGADAGHVATLLAAARLAGCEAAFAQAEIKETWDVFPDEDQHGGNWYDYDEEPEEYDEDEGSGDTGEGYALNELLDDEITLGWWVGTDGSAAESIKLPLGEYEVCSATPTQDIQALPERLRRLHGQLRKHRGPVVQPCRAGAVAPGAVLRSACRGRVDVGFAETAGESRCRGIGVRQVRCRVAGAILVPCRARVAQPGLARCRGTGRHEVGARGVGTIQCPDG